MKEEKDFFTEDTGNTLEDKIFQLNYFLLILLGIIIFFTGGIIRAITGFDFDWVKDSINIRATALIIMNLGILTSCIGFMIGAWKPSNLDIKIKSSMIVATGSCLIAGAVINIILFM